MSKTKEQIDVEITNLAEQMVKSVTDSKQLLFDTIMNLGPENLKKAVASLSDSEKEVLKSCVADLQKAKEVSQEITPKKTETKAADMKTEALSGSDDEDEKKLMDEKNAEHPHQGGPKDKPEGWQGQVIKAKKEDEEPEVEMPAKEAVKEHKRLVNVLESDSKKDDKEEAKKQKKELKEYQSEMKKADDKAVDALIQIEEAEHNKDINGDGKIAEKLEKEKKMKKSLEEIVELAKSLNMSKEEVIKTIKDSNDDLELVKGKMKEKFAEQGMKLAEPKKEDEGSEADKKEDKKEKKMEKSVNWNFKSSIAANTLGRNTHWDVDSYIEKSEAEKQEIIKKGGYFGETQGEPLQKSDSKKVDINDLIEKGHDYSTDEIKRIEGIRDHKIEGKVVKSFHDEDIAAALGMTKEEYKKLMGE